jgi:integrase
MKDVLEMNLFIEYRYRGRFLPPKKGGHKNLLGGVTVKTIKSIANSLLVFLRWLESQNISFQELYAVSLTNKTKEWLPPYRFKSHLIRMIEEHKLSLNTANLYISHVRQFYEWAWHTRRASKLPFTYKDKVIQKKRSDAEFDLIFSPQTAFRSKGIVVQTNDLTIPKKYNQKKMQLDQGLSPFNHRELQVFYKSKYMQHQTRRLWADLALFCGLRAFEITLLNENSVTDPSHSDTKLFRTKIIGKHNKFRQIIIPVFLMKRLWIFKNSPERLSGSAKWDSKYSIKNKPLFINRSGNRINEGSVKNIPSIARNMESPALKFNRSFHDLRATFATSLALYLLKQDLPSGFIQYQLMSLLGHSSFRTTQKYIDFSKSTTYDKQMSSWVAEVFADFENNIDSDINSLIRT